MVAELWRETPSLLEPPAPAVPLTATEPVPPRGLGVVAGQRDVLARGRRDVSIDIDCTMRQRREVDRDVGRGVVERDRRGRLEEDVVLRVGERGGRDRVVAGVGEVGGTGG